MKRDSSRRFLQPLAALVYTATVLPIDAMDAYQAPGGPVMDPTGRMRIQAQHGDTLYKFAQQSLPPGASHSDVMHMVSLIAMQNGLSDPNKINEGQSLSMAHSFNPEQQYSPPQQTASAMSAPPGAQQGLQSSNSAPPGVAQSPSLSQAVPGGAPSPGSGAEPPSSNVFYPPLQDHEQPIGPGTPATAGGWFQQDAMQAADKQANWPAFADASKNIGMAGMGLMGLRAGMSPAESAPPGMSERPPISGPTDFGSGRPTKMSGPADFPPSLASATGAPRPGSPPGMSSIMGSPGMQNQPVHFPPSQSELAAGLRSPAGLQSTGPLSAPSLPMRQPLPRMGAISPGEALTSRMRAPTPTPQAPPQFGSLSMSPPPGQGIFRGTVPRDVKFAGAAAGLAALLSGATLGVEHRKSPASVPVRGSAASEPKARPSPRAKPRTLKPATDFEPESSESTPRKSQGKKQLKSKGKKQRKAMRAGTGKLPAESGDVSGRQAIPGGDSKFFRDD